MNFQKLLDQKSLIFKINIDKKCVFWKKNLQGPPDQKIAICVFKSSKKNFLNENQSFKTSDLKMVI